MGCLFGKQEKVKRDTESKYKFEMDENGNILYNLSFLY
jgi:hypothetical protein